MNILITGANGQLGSEIREISPMFKDLNFTFTDIDELDITNYNALGKFFLKNKFDCIINCAGYTAVDKAEAETEMAMRLNATAVKNLAEFSSTYNSLFVHVSTDYVFDGKNYKPYSEGDLTNPKSAYGKTKLEGEVEIIFNAQKAVIFRTSWLYSSYGNNFVKAILKNAKEKGALNVVNDQIGSPTYAKDLAKAILDIIPIYKAESKFEILNYSNEGVCSWYDFAKEIIEIAGIDCPITPIESKDYPTAATRPFYSVLNKAKIRKQFGISIPHWKDSLKECLNLLKEQK
jgi:dTDP-4-dehydrorhamnose reductase